MIIKVCEREKKRKGERYGQKWKKKRMKEPERKIKNEKYWKKREGESLREEERKKLETDKGAELEKGKKIDR